MLPRRLALIGIAVVLLVPTGGAQDPINRLACTVLDPANHSTRLAFTDAETGAVATFPLPWGYVPNQGYVPNVLIAMDRHGDVWLDDMNSYALRKFSGRDGSLLATILPRARPTYMVTDQNADLLVGSYDYVPTGGSIYVERFASDGTLLNSVDLPSLFPPGVFLPANSPPYVNWGHGIPRMLITRSGAIWVIARSSRHNPVLLLNPNLTLQASYGLYAPMSLLPDSGEGVWVLYNYIDSLTHFPAIGPPMPGSLARGWIHLSSTGAILETTIDANATSSYPYNFGQARNDGRHHQYVYGGGGTTLPYHVWVHEPSGPTIPWYSWVDRVIFNPAQAYLIGFHLDGAQRLWALRHHIPTSLYDWSRTRWERYPIEPPYNNPLVADVGETPRPNYANVTFEYWTSFWGNASLYEYVFYTDPYGDLDGDGVPNQVELSTFSNALLANNFSGAAWATGAGRGPGHPFAVTYRVPDDAGLVYAAPFALSRTTFPLGGGWFLPVFPQDPLVSFSLRPGAPGISGTLGVLNSFGGATATIQVPNDPSLSGFGFSTCIVTVDPNLPIPFKTISHAFGFTIP